MPVRRCSCPGDICQIAFRIELILCGFRTIKLPHHHHHHHRHRRRRRHQLRGCRGGSHDPSPCAVSFKGRHDVPSKGKSVTDSITRTPASQPPLARIPHDGCARPRGLRTPARRQWPLHCQNIGGDRIVLGPLCPVSCSGLTFCKRRAGPAAIFRGASYVWRRRTERSTTHNAAFRGLRSLRPAATISLALLYLAFAYSSCGCATDAPALFQFHPAHPRRPFEDRLRATSRRWLLSRGTADRARGTKRESKTAIAIKYYAERENT